MCLYDQVLVVASFEFTRFEFSSFTRTAKEITAGGRKSVVGGQFQEVGGGITASGALGSGPIGRMSEDRRLSIPSSWTKLKET